MDTLFQSELIQSLGSNFYYVALMIGMWLAITAIYVPGTGVPELGALALLMIGGVGLLAFPVNPVGLVLLVAAVGCFVGRIFFRQIWVLWVAGFILQLVGSYFLFTDEARPALWAIGIVTLVALAYHRFVLMPGLQIQNRARQTGGDTLIDEVGEVVSTLDPVGTIRIQGAVWRARADEVIGGGRWVRVVSRNGLELRVIPAEPPRLSR